MARAHVCRAGLFRRPPPFAFRHDLPDLDTRAADRVAASDVATGLSSCTVAARRSAMPHLLV
jgi:hypothetical protein